MGLILVFIMPVIGLQQAALVAETVVKTVAAMGCTV